ncbi:MAG: DUF308 domain-containing protein [Prolixibacteraceae bacterium]|jgi:uncharacterized membrane protein HdeD (DUF308 family)|nr:DUF308 domain-containing protein [Prolixibacteraceae bacterium]
MILFTSANPNRLLLRGILAMLAGITVVAVPGFSLKTLMQFLGIVLLADGLIAFLTDYFSTKQRKVLPIVPRGVSNLVIGFILVVFPTLLVNVFVFVIGLLLVLAGASQLMNLLGTRGRIGFSWPMLVISMVSLVAGIILIAHPFESARAVLVLFGIVVFVYGLGELLWSFKIRKLRQIQAKQNPGVVDTEYEEVKE